MPYVNTYRNNALLHCKTFSPTSSNSVHSNSSTSRQRPTSSTSVKPTTKDLQLLKDQPDQYPPRIYVSRLASAMKIHNWQNIGQRRTELRWRVNWQLDELTRQMNGTHLDAKLFTAVDVWITNWRWITRPGFVSTLKNGQIITVEWYYQGIVDKAQALESSREWQLLAKP